MADVVRTSLGPRGMDKMIQDGKGQVLITNDGATILKQIQVVHPTAKMVHLLSPHFFLILNSLLKSPKHKILKLAMEQPRWW